MKTKQIAKTVYKTVYITKDGKEFDNEYEANAHEQKLNGTRKQCPMCGGRGLINIRKTMIHQSGYPIESHATGDTCKTCDGKGYLEKVTEWK